MTTSTMPLMPFSVPLRPSLDAYALFIPPEFRNHSNSYPNQSIKLEPGVSQVRIMWSGLEPIRYRVTSDDSSTAWERAIEPSTEITPRSSKIINVVLTETGYFWAQTSSPASATTMNAEARVGVMIIPMATPQT